eukprot:TRINITY_DN2443_c0_g3_i3.p3 TRINITY_DN2443_c0_g3~~TRINITY_DN2443_c0_g3_i3.p3  ORF type:complete len:102 (+),score=2.39 TRINITY_DN2443_c0_g3_i3:495-800(+)
MPGTRILSPSSPAPHQPTTTDITNALPATRRDKLGSTNALPRTAQSVRTPHAFASRPRVSPQATGCKSNVSKKPSVEPLCALTGGPSPPGRVSSVSSASGS